MNKKGALEYYAIFITLLTTVSALAIIAESKHIYIGDKEAKKVYDYSICPEKIKNIPEQNQIMFKNLKEAEKENYFKEEGCTP